jgi:hypothetical protein
MRTDALVPMGGASEVILLSKILQRLIFHYTYSLPLCIAQYLVGHILNFCHYYRLEKQEFLSVATTQFTYTAKY